MRHRCDYCGRFYSSPLPDGDGCREHANLGRQEREERIDAFNRRVAASRRDLPSPYDAGSPAMRDAIREMAKYR